MPQIRRKEVPQNQDTVKSCWGLNCFSVTLASLAFALGLAIVTVMFGVETEREERTLFDGIRNYFWREEEEKRSYFTLMRKTGSTLLYYATSTFHSLIQYIHNEPSHLEPGRLSVQILLGIILLTGGFLWLISYIRSHRGDSTWSADDHYFNQQLHRTWTLFRKYLSILIIFAVLISIPWEYIRLYQNEVSRKAAVTIKGMPEECQPNQMSFWVAIRSWFLHHFSWTENPCEQYHKAILVDPFWEISPLLVLSSLFTRCITHPLETIGVNFGLSLRAFFSHVPAQWQPIIMILAFSLIIIATIMTCSYQVSVPMMFSLQPSKVKDCPNVCAKTRKTRGNAINNPNNRRAIKSS